MTIETGYGLLQFNCAVLLLLFPWSFCRFDGNSRAGWKNNFITPFQESRQCEITRDIQTMSLLSVVIISRRFSSLSRSVIRDYYFLSVLPPSSVVLELVD